MKYRERMKDCQRETMIGRMPIAARVECAGRMAIKTPRLLVAGAMVMAIGACSSTPQRTLPPLMPAPTPPVQQSTLPPPTYQVPPTEEAPPGETAPAVQDAPATVPPPSSEPIKQTDVLGQWSLISGGSTCTANVTLTGWSGGYRASTRNCGNPALSALGAWNIEGNQVILKDISGNPIGILSRTGASRFDGRLNAGGAVSLVR